MSEIMAYCGLLCGECPAYKATVADDMAIREKTAKAWSKMFGREVVPETINCLGCNSDVLFSHCSVCEIRACAQGKGIAHCGKCGDFACEKVTGVLKHDGSAQKRLSKQE